MLLKVSDTGLVYNMYKLCSDLDHKIQQRTDRSSEPMLSVHTKARTSQQLDDMEAHYPLPHYAQVATEKATELILALDRRAALRIRDFEIAPGFVVIVLERRTIVMMRYRHVDGNRP